MWGQDCPDKNIDECDCEYCTPIEYTYDEDAYRFEYYEEWFEYLEGCE